MVCDVGCGALGGGRWLIPLLDRGHYCGIEPNVTWVTEGTRRFIDPAVLEVKSPRFDHNANFDLTVFGEEFTHVLLRSIWTHAAKSQIEACLDGFAATAAPGGVMLSSVFPIRPGRRDYKGSEWVGRSHESNVPGVISHSPRWLYSACRRRGLKVTLVPRWPVMHQLWVKVTAR
jgi:hypothetical protein